MKYFDQYLRLTIIQQYPKPKQLTQDTYEQYIERLHKKNQQHPKRFFIPIEQLIHEVLQEEKTSFL